MADSQAGWTRAEKGGRLKLASDPADCLECERLREQLAKAESDLEALFRIGEATSIEGFESIVAKVIEQLASIVGAESGGIVLYDQDEAGLVLQSPAFGMSEDDFKGYALPITGDGDSTNGAGVSMRVFLTGEPYVCNSPFGDPATNQSIVSEYNISNNLSVPLTLSGRVIGVLHLINKRSQPFTENDARLVMMLASHLAAVIQNAHLVRRLESQNRALERSREIHDELTEAVLQGRSLDDITATLSRLINCNVVVEDRFFHRLSVGGVPGEPNGWEAKAHVSEEEAWAEEFQSFLREVVASKMPVPIPEPEDSSSPPRLIMPIKAGAHCLGFVLVLPADGELGPLDLVAIEHSATVLALKLSQEKIAHEVEERIRGNLLHDVLTGVFPSETDILERAGYFGYDLRQPFQVLVVQIQDENGKNLEDLGGRWANAVKAVVQEHSSHSISGFRTDHLFVLASTRGEAPPVELAYLLERRLATLREGVSVLVGVSDESTGPSHIKHAYRQARETLQIAQLIGQNHGVVQYDQLSVFRLLLQVKDRGELHRFAVQVLGPLEEYDRRRSTHLVETLRHVLYRDDTFTGVASRLLVHPNTLKYRLRRIEEISGFKVDKPSDRFKLQMALAVSQILEATAE